MSKELEKEVARLKKALKYLIGKVRAATKEIHAEVKTTGTSNAAKRIGDIATVLESQSIITESVFQPKSEIFDKP